MTPGARELRAIVGELYALHHVLRSFGIAAEHLFVFVAEVEGAPPPAHYVCVRVSRPVAGSAPLEATFVAHAVQPEWREAVERAWTTFVTEELPTAPDAVLDELVRGARVRGKVGKLAHVLASKGLLAELERGLEPAELLQ